MIQIGTRNMFNYELLKEVGKTKTPVLLKRSFSAERITINPIAMYAFIALTQRLKSDETKPRPSRHLLLIRLAEWGV